jgi:hypothetical protein
MCTLFVASLTAESASAGDIASVDDARTPHASFQHNDSVRFDEPQSDWTTGIVDANDIVDGDAPLVTLERPAILMQPDGFGIIRSDSTPAYRLSDYALSIDLIRLGEALKAASEWYQQPRKVADDAKLVVDSFYHFGREVVDEGLVLVRSRSQKKGLQAQLGPTWMRGGPAARLKVSF